MAGHGAHLAAIAVEVEDVAGLVAMVAAARAQLVHAANADTWALAAWRAERLALARGLGPLSLRILMVDHIQAGLDGQAGRLVLLVSVALDKLRHHTHGIGRCVLQAPASHNATDEHRRERVTVPGK